MMNRTKKQHYISNSILDIFFKTNRIHEYNLNEHIDYDCSTGKSMCCTDIYECGLFKDNKLEDAFAQLYDGQFANTLSKIDSFLLNKQVESAIDLLRHNFYYYLVSYYKSLASLVRLSKNDKHTLDKNKATTRMFELITDIAYMKKMSVILTNCYDIYIIKSWKSNFVLSDQFISTVSNYFNGMFSNISNRDIGVKGSIILFPVSVDFYFLLYDKTMSKSIDKSQNSINILSEQETEKINNIIYNNATEKVCTIRGEKYSFINVNSFGDEFVFMFYSNHSSAGYIKKKEIFYSEEEQEVYEMFGNLEWGKYTKLGRNEKCFCGSNKKFKNCCYEKVERCKSIIINIKNNSLSEKSVIDKLFGLEKS
ncbi:MAG: DUF4238 domain-containing protein, partial [Clostridia bacterium]|nr:DUF4238 domain-containing protein [Clostridia bacterium]